MVFEVIVAILVPILVLIGGLVLLVFSSDTAVEHSVSIASALGASPLIIGIVLVSLGTESSSENHCTHCPIAHAFLG